ncbi:MAG: hypothetical protein R3Y68_08575 [Rikenellaceae bacterium]
MAYKVRSKFEKKTIVVAKPEYRSSGRFVLAKCTQEDLKYLYTVVKHPAIVEYDEAEK